MSLYVFGSMVVWKGGRGGRGPSWTDEAELRSAQSILIKQVLCSSKGTTRAGHGRDMTIMASMGMTI